MSAVDALAKGDQDGLWPGLNLSVVGLWGVTQWIEGLCLFFSL